MAGARAVGVEMEQAAGKATRVRGKLSVAHAAAAGVGGSHTTIMCNKITPKGLSSNLRPTIHLLGDPAQAAQPSAQVPPWMLTEGPAAPALGQ